MKFYSAFKRLAFIFDPEFSHEATLHIGSILPQMAKPFTQIKSNAILSNHDLSLKSPHLQWNFPVGVAAGFDKNAQAIKFFENFGFGALEVGTITLKPQKGNPKPRIFRITEHESLRNAMGFPNDGLDTIYKRIKKSTHSLCLGSNIGKNKNTDIENTPSEYAKLYEKLAPVSDYIAINISSPNTPGLRDFQKIEFLKPIIQAVKEKQLRDFRPIFIKVSPDMDKQDCIDICNLIKTENLQGIIATNTTSDHSYENGGVSGNILKSHAKKIRKICCENLDSDKYTIIGVGGINSYEEIKEFWKMGGHFVQIYTSFIYQGPKILDDIAKEMTKDLKKHSCSNLNELRNFYKNNN